MAGESNQNVFLIQIRRFEFAEFEISEFEISKFDYIHKFSTILASCPRMDSCLLWWLLMYNADNYQLLVCSRGPFWLAHSSLPVLPIKTSKWKLCITLTILLCLMILSLVIKKNFLLILNEWGILKHAA